MYEIKITARNKLNESLLDLRDRKTITGIANIENELL
jgi:hypothetical protein